MNLKDLILGGAVVATIFLIAFVVFSLSPTKTQKTDVTQPQTYGAAGSPIVSGGCMDVNGVVTCPSKFALTLATSTPCAVKSPAATSTLLAAAMRVSSTSAAATYIEFGKATTQYATTTSLGIVTLGANAQGTAIASTSRAWPSIDGPTLFSPNTYLVVKIAGNTQIAGSCQATFEII